MHGDTRDTALATRRRSVHGTSRAGAVRVTRTDCYTVSEAQLDR